MLKCLQRLTDAGLCHPKSVGGRSEPSFVNYSNEDTKLRESYIRSGNSGYLYDLFSLFDQICLIGSSAAPLVNGSNMSGRINLAIVGDYNSAFIPHNKTNDSLEHVRRALGVEINAEWIATAELEHDHEAKLARRP